MCSLPRAGARHASEWTRLNRLADTLLDSRLRTGSKSTYSSAVRHFSVFCRARGADPLPATVGLLRAYIAHCVYDLKFQPSTIIGRISAISDWHRRQQVSMTRAGFEFINPCGDSLITTLLKIVRKRSTRGPALARLPLLIQEFCAIYARGFDLSTAHGFHHRLCLMLLNLGCLRRGAASALRVVYSIAHDGSITYGSGSNIEVRRDGVFPWPYIKLRLDMDKNVDSREEALGFIPDYVQSLDIWPVEIFESYLRRFRPPSGGFLLTPPTSARLHPPRFGGQPYKGFSRAFRAAYVRAFPAAGQRSADTDRVSAHSGRKSLAQWLWDAYRSNRLIADVGRWACREDAKDAYFKTSPNQILHLLRRL